MANIFKFKNKSVKHQIVYLVIISIIVMYLAIVYLMMNYKAYLYRHNDKVIMNELQLISEVIECRFEVLESYEKLLNKDIIEALNFNDKKLDINQKDINNDYLKELNVFNSYDELIYSSSDASSETTEKDLSYEKTQTDPNSPFLFKRYIYEISADEIKIIHSLDDNEYFAEYVYPLSELLKVKFDNEVYEYMIFIENVGLTDSSAIGFKAGEDIEEVTSLDIKLNTLEIGDNILLMKTRDKGITANLLKGIGGAVTIIFIFAVIQIVIAGFIIDKSIRSPLISLLSQMKTIKKEYINDISNENVVNEIDVRAENEFKVIACYMNNLFHKIQSSNALILDTQRDLYEKEISLKNTELALLYSQINPHFLYNTLECIRSIACVNQIEEIEEISVDMAKILRYAIDENKMVTLNKELDITKSYMRIMKNRYPNYYKYDFDIDEELLEQPFVKMSLQPIVENIFKHAFKKSKGIGKIAICVSLFNDVIITEISDNGIGISSERVNQIQSNINENITTNNIGLSNVHRRVKEAFGHQYGIHIFSELNHGTTIELKTTYKKK